jgi:DNA-binding protein H-NS
MAKKTLEQIQAQIDKLNLEAQAIRAKEVAVVIQRIKREIAEFGLSADDLGLVTDRAPVRKARGVSVVPVKAKMPKMPKTPAVKGAKAKSTGSRAAKKASAAIDQPTQASKRAAAGTATQTIGVIKYADDHGHTWTGRGKRPGWFLAELESGRSADELLVTAAKS